MTVLVLDADLLPSLAIVRSLGRKGVKCDIASSALKPICQYSKFAGEVLRYPDPMSETQAFTHWLGGILAEDRYQLVIPVTERTLVPIARTFQDSKYLSRITVPPLESLETVLDKSCAEPLVQSLGIPTAKTCHLNSLEELTKLLPGLKFPLVIKPARSISDRGERVSLQVRYAHNGEELQRICKHLLRHCHLLLQEYFQGTGVGIELIADRGEIRYAFQHERLHEVPLTGGGSSYRKSTEIFPPLLEASRKIISRLAWHGVAMVEFKWNKASGEFIFIEVNGRFWGSLPLAVAAGADFPHMLFQLYQTGKIENAEEYRREVLCRKLSSDLGWYEAVLRRDADTRLVRLPGKKEILRDSLAVLSPKHYMDAQSFSDPQPGIVDLGRIIARYYRRVRAIVADRRYRKRYLKRTTPQQLLQHLADARHILFICYGNINRSAAAHAIAAQQTSLGKTFELRSAGFHKEDGRPADLQMQHIASRHGTDLSACRSCLVTPELLQWADIIFVMEVAHVERLQEMDSGAYHRSFLLGALDKSNPADWEIADPYNRSEAFYEATFLRLNSALTILDAKLHDQDNAS